MNIRPIDVIAFVVILGLIIALVYTSTRSDDQPSDTATSTTEVATTTEPLTWGEISESCENAGGRITWTLMASSSRALLSCTPNQLPTNQ